VGAGDATQTSTALTHLRITSQPSIHNLNLNLNLNQQK
jgi:hypothetical protein